MAGLYCDITLLASVGKETATKTISRQAILYSSSGLMFSAQAQNYIVSVFCPVAACFYQIRQHMSIKRRAVCKVLDNHVLIFAFRTNERWKHAKKRLVRKSLSGQRLCGSDSQVVARLSAQRFSQILELWTLVMFLNKSRKKM